MKYIHGLVNKQKKLQHTKDKKRIDQGQKEVGYVVGDLVLAYAPPRIPGSQKLVVKFRGPFEIEKVLAQNAFRLRWKDSDNKKRFTANARNIVKFNVRVPEPETEWADVDSSLPRPRPPPRARQRAQRSPNDVLGGELEDKPETEEDLIALRNATNKNIFLHKTVEKGWGVYARVQLAARTILTEYTGERLTHEEHEERYRKEGSRFGVTTERGVIDARDWRTASWARYCNAPGPNESRNAALVEGDDGRVFVRVTRVVHVGEEIMVNYGDAYAWEHPPQDGPRKKPKVPSLPQPPPFLSETLQDQLYEDPQNWPDFETESDEDSDTVPPPPPSEEDSGEEENSGPPAEDRPAESDSPRAPEQKQGAVELLDEDIKVGDYLLVRTEMPPAIYPWPECNTLT